jgi:hypothetical protein
MHNPGTLNVGGSQTWHITLDLWRFMIDRLSISFPLSVYPHVCTDDKNAANINWLGEVFKRWSCQHITEIEVCESPNLRVAVERHTQAGVGLINEPPRKLRAAAR